MQIKQLSDAAGTQFPPGLKKLEYRTDLDDWAMLYGHSPHQIGVVVLHGHGSGGDQLLVRPDLKSWLDSLLGHGLGFLTPNLRGNAWMCPEAVNDLEALIRWVKEEFGWRKIILASGSMGGTGNLIFAMLRPELADAVIALGAATDLPRYLEWLAQQELPVCGEIHEAILTAYRHDPVLLAAHSVERHAEKLAMPVWYSHGSRDRLMPVSEAQSLAAKFPAHGRFHFHEIPDGEHDSPLQLFEKYLDKAVQYNKELVE
jgi:pimeloyl-ACP methyl ester carboxylesterase